MKLLILILLSSFELFQGNPILNKQSLDWWKTDVFYQIYPRSFKDTNGDGIGDLVGVKDSLVYLKKLGIRSTWLSPIFKSPMVDAGYDISDFRDIDPVFGSLTDFEDLIAEANRLGVRIILDFVPNHSSDKHEWFEKSVNRIDPYTNYYVWNDGKLVNGSRVPPNNWIAPMAHSSAWEWNPKRQQYYYHRYAKEMPDLNYRNLELVNEMKEIIRFWLNKGVAGFRVDAISRLFEDSQLRDDPVSNKPGCTSIDECYILENRYSADLPETVDMVIQWQQVLEEYNEINELPRILMTESYSDLDKIMRFYGNATHDGAAFPFNFQMISKQNLNSTAADYKEVIDTWLGKMPEGRTPNWVLGNHDRSRVATRLGVSRVDALNMLVMTLPGVGITYNGEEIGMENGFVSWEDTQDPTALSAGKDKYLEVTRDPERTPFHWNNWKNAGFSNASKTWLPVSEKYVTNNVHAQFKSKNESHIKVYQELLALRQTEVLKYGKLSTVVLKPNVLVVSRKIQNNGLYTIINIGSDVQIVNLMEICKCKQLLIELNNVGSKLKKGFRMRSDENITLSPSESYILTNVE